VESSCCLGLVLRVGGVAGVLVNLVGLDLLADSGVDGLLKGEVRVSITIVF
jgi:hypothetical protein